MNLQIRVVLLLSGIVTLVSASIGTFALSQSYQNQLAFNDSKIENVILQLKQTSEDPLSLATFVADQSDFLFSLSLVTQERQVVVLIDNAGELSEKPKSNLLKVASDRPTNFGENRIRSLKLEGDEYLIVGYSLSELREIRSQNQLYLGAFTLFVLVVAILLSYFLFRRDAQLNRAARALNENQERMLEFLGDAAHELRTPLTVVRGYFDLIKNGRSDGNKVKDYEIHIDREISRMQKLIDELLLVAELESREISDNATSNLSTNLFEQISQLKELQPGREIRSAIDKDIFVKIEQEDLNRLLGNIFSNIKRYTPDDSPLEVYCRRSGKSISLEISDSGPGLPEKFYKDGVRAFRRFDSSRSREAGGSGLGMSIIQKVLNRWGGKLELTPSKAGGLKIRVLLKLSQDQAPR
jgi:two-component system OmpR family sensor kinase